MRVLVACEFSGTVRDAFLARGHDAVSADLLPSEKPGPHYQGDARDILGDGWDLLIAHPPCTRLCNSGVRWLEERGLWDDMREAASLFLDFLNAPIPRVAVENPVMHGHARGIIGRGPDFTIQPWMFGDGEVKRTCFWTRNLIPLRPTHFVEGRADRIHRLAPSDDRAKLRSVTYPGIAAAMADQWGCSLPEIAGRRHAVRTDSGAGPLFDGVAA